MKLEPLKDYIGDYLAAKSRLWLYDSVDKALTDFPFEEGIDESIGEQYIWSAAFIWAIAKHRDLDHPDSIYRMTLPDLAKYFDVDPVHIQKRAEKIGIQLDLTHHQNRYQSIDLQYIRDEFILNEPDMDDPWVYAGLTFKYIEQIDPPKFEQLDGLVHEMVVLVNQVGYDDQLSIDKLKYKKSRFKIDLVGYEEQIEYFIDLLSEFDLKFKKYRFFMTIENRFTPSLNYTMFMEQYEVMGLDDKEFDHEAELKAELDRFMGKTIDEIKSERPLSPSGQALLDALNAYELEMPKSLAIVNKLIEQFPDCVEAHICLAGWQRDADATILHLENALAAGDRTLDIVELDKNKVWWGYYKTRPYMRAMRLLAEEYLGTSKEEEGMDILWELIEMNKMDNQGNRVLLMEELILAHRWPDVRELFVLYPNDEFLTFYYAKVIYYYYTLGKKSKTRRALFEAYQRNKHPLRMLAGVEDFPERLEDHFRFGDKNEALEVVPLLDKCLTKDKKLLHWIMETLIQSGHWDDGEQDHFDFTNIDGQGRLRDN